MIRKQNLHWTWKTNRLGTFADGLNIRFIHSTVGLHFSERYVHIDLSLA